MIRTVPSPANRALNRFTSGPAIVLYIAAVKLMLHLATANRYGIFRDEMYYWAGSMRMTEETNGAKNSGSKSTRSSMMFSIQRRGNTMTEFFT